MKMDEIKAIARQHHIKTGKATKSDLAVFSVTGSRYPI